MFLLDTGLRVRAANPAVLRDFGLGPGQVTGWSIYDLDDGRWDVPALRSVLEDALRGDIEPEDCSVEYRAEDGGRRSLLLTARRIDGRGGRTEGVVLAVEDVTARKWAEESLREGEKRFRQLAENIHDVFWMTDIPELRVLYVSPAYEETWGRTCQSLYEQPLSWIDSVHPDDRGTVIAHVEQLRRGEIGVTEYRVVRPDGSVRWIRDRAFPIEDQAGNVYRLAGLAEDVTERKRAEDEIRRLNGHLKRRLQGINALRGIDAAITTGRDLCQALALIVEQAIDQLGVDAADVLFYDEVAGILELAAVRGISSEALGRTWPGSDGLARRVAREGCPLHVPDLAHAPAPDARVHRLLEERFVAYHAIPLAAEGRVKGVLECFHRAPIEPDAEWLGFAGMLAGQAATAIDNAALLEGLRRSNEELRAAYDATIEGWSRALDLRDKETEGHSRRVTEMALHLARAVGLGEADLVHIRRGALLHDIGKLGVPDAILHKTGPLTEEEWVAMRRHPGYAVEMLGPIQFLGPSLDIPHYHHERWDGTGYPCGLAGEQIPLAARIFAAVDIWDALRHDRPYRRAWPPERVREHLRTLAGNHLDPRVVEVFLGFLAGEGLMTAGASWAAGEPSCEPTATMLAD
jgi:PAS domain S-box-containing protein/putative nucleotidyltransferase with HDIG domain